jgi:hypothetical protein
MLLRTSIGASCDVTWGTTAQSHHWHCCKSSKASSCMLGSPAASTPVSLLLLHTKILRVPHASLSSASFLCQLCTTGTDTRLTRLMCCVVQCLTHRGRALSCLCSSCGLLCCSRVSPVQVCMPQVLPCAHVQQRPPHALLLHIHTLEEWEAGFGRVLKALARKAPPYLPGCCTLALGLFRALPRVHYCQDGHHGRRSDYHEAEWAHHPGKEVHRGLPFRCCTPSSALRPLSVTRVHVWVVYSLRAYELLRRLVASSRCNVAVTCRTSTWPSKHCLQHVHQR